MTRLGRKDMATWLFRPRERPSAAALAYIAAGEFAGVDQAYKCRVRKPWWRVPLMPSADLFLTYMNADTPRLTTNSARSHHLNSVHGVYLSDETRQTGMELLPLASLNSATLLSAEITGRAYGGGILKIEPREADAWLVPSYDLVLSKAAELRAIRGRVANLLQQKKLADAVEIVDELLLAPSLGADLEGVKNARAAMAARRMSRTDRVW